MTETDFVTFAKAFGRMCSAFRLRLKPDESSDLTRTYFKLLEPFALDAVLLTGRRQMERGKKFPLAAEWIEALERQQAPAAADRRQMTVSEMAEYDAAVRDHYVAQPCLCPECVRAGVDDRELRFVPTTWGAEQTDETAFHTRRNQVVLVGHWAHGEELRRWYEQREAFAAATKRFTTRTARVFVRRDREPGEEG